MADEAKVDIELNASEGAKDVLTGTADAADRAAKSVDKLKKSLDSLRPNSLLDDFMALGNDGPVAPRDPHAVRNTNIARRRNIRQQRIDQGLVDAPMSQADRDLQSRERAFERQQRFGKAPVSAEERWAQQRQSRADKTNWEVAQGLRVDPTAARAVKEEARLAKETARAEARATKDAERLAAREAKAASHQDAIPQSLNGLIRYGSKQVAGSMGMTAESMAAAGLTAAAMTAGLYIGREVVGQFAHVARAINRADAHGFTTVAERQAAIGSSLPLIGGVLDDSRALGMYITGESKSHGEVARRRAYDEVQVSGGLHIQAEQQKMFSRRMEAQSNYDAAKGFNPYIVQGPRITMLDRRAYDEKSARAAGINRMERGAAAEDAGDTRLNALSRERFKLQTEQASLQKERDAMQKKVNESIAADVRGGTGGTRLSRGLESYLRAANPAAYAIGAGSAGNSSQTMDLQRQLQAFDDKLAAAKDRLTGNTNEGKATRLQQARNRGEIQGGLIDSLKGDKDVAEYRADASRSYNQRLGAMGPEGRIRAQQEAQLVKWAGGVENLSPAAYANWANQNPDSAREEQEKVGRRLRGSARANAPSETGAAFEQEQQVNLAKEIETQIAALDKQRNVGMAKAFADALAASDADLLELMKSVLAGRMDRLANDRLGQSPTQGRQ